MTWSYDATYQLTREQRDGDNSYDVTYTYDAGGNRLTKVDAGDTTTYTYDAANQLSTEDDGTTVTTHSYDENGNLTVQDAGGSVTTYTRDAESRITLIALPDDTVQTMTYDATGMRRQKETAAATAVFVWDGQDVLLDTNGNGSTQARYTLTPDELGLLIAQRRDSATSFYHFDALGSAVGLTDTDETQTDTYRYYAFGELLTSTGNTVNPYGYVGRLGYYHEPTLALQYLRARWYRPAIGRFLRPDPVVRLDQYLYGRNAPLIHADARGLWAAEIHKTKTTEWAKDAREIGPLPARLHLAWKRFGKCLYPRIGKACNRVDFDPDTEPMQPRNWKYHYDWPPVAFSDMNLWQRERSRDAYFGAQFSKAVNLVTAGPISTGTGEECQKAVEELGKGLHALEDSFAHLLDPHEHMHEGNAEYVDKPEWDRGRLLAEEPFKLKPFCLGAFCVVSSVINTTYRAGGWYALLERTRRWEWVRGSTRIGRTEQATFSALKLFLATTPCGEEDT